MTSPQEKMDSPIVFYKFAYVGSDMDAKWWYIARDCVFFGEKDDLKKHMEKHKYLDDWKNEDEYIITQFNNGILTKKSYGDDFTEYPESIYVFKKNDIYFTIKEDGKCVFEEEGCDDGLIEDELEIDNCGTVKCCIDISRQYTYCYV